MDKTLINTKHIQLWLSTVEIGLGIICVPQNKDLVITIGLFHLCIDWIKDCSLVR